MPKKKLKLDADKPKGRRKPSRSRGSGAGGFFRAFTRTPLRQLIIVIIIVALLAIFWGSIERGINALVNTFGWGLVFVIGAILTLIVLVWRRKIGPLFIHWNLTLGSIAFILAVWGFLAFLRLGGSFGDEIIAWPAPDWIGVLRLLALAVIGLFLMIPRGCWHFLCAFFGWIARQFERRPASEKPVRKQPPLPTHRSLHPKTPGGKPPLPAEMDAPVIAPEVAASVANLEALANKAAALKAAATNPPRMPEPKPEPKLEEPKAEAKSDTRQVAQDVWKKYGQSSDLVIVDGWRLPPIDILDVTPEMEFSQADNMQRAQLIEEALASYGVDAKVVQINSGPTVTQFGVEPGWDRKIKEIKEKDKDGNITVRTEEISKTRVKVERINSLGNDLALALAAPTIRIEAPVPGKAIVGIEVPNTTSDMVSLRGVIETTTFQKQEAKTKLAVALGKGAGGETVAGDLAKMPHLLIAGATGSGKTVCLNAVICGLLMYNSPNDVRFIMIDPKRVELTPYNSIPHLATPVIVDTHKALNALRWLAKEMDDRYQKLASSQARHIEGYNKNRTGEDRLPYLVLVIDELADLMMTGFDEVEGILCRLAQLARAVGIHLVVATQRPSVDVVTGLIKANFPTRISFAVTSQIDSRTILDSAGAEKLLGHGDMLYLPTDAAKPKRLQGCFLSDAEMERLVYFWGSQRTEEAEALQTIIPEPPSNEVGGHPRDPLLEKALELAHEHTNVSTSFLQRKLHIGYPRAARLMEQVTEELEKAVDEKYRPEDFDEIVDSDEDFDDDKESYRANWEDYKE